jgi:hypothetical protein
MEAGRMTAGSGRVGALQRDTATAGPLRLDPFALPVRFETSDEAADGCRRVVDIHRERIVVRRAVRGMRMALNLPVAVFRGVALRFADDADETPGGLAVVLEHRDPALSLPLCGADAAEDAAADWQSWGRVLGLPLLIAEQDGSLHEPFARLGALRIGSPTWRRRRRTAVARRRPSFLVRRRSGAPLDAAMVHRGEREIIART